MGMLRPRKSSTSSTVARARNLARHGKAVDVVVHEDPKRLAEYRKLMSLLAGGEREQATGFDEYWEAVGRILDDQLYDVGGFHDAKTWIAEEIGQPVRSVMRLVRVARHATPKEEAHYTTSKLDAALGFIEARTGGPVKGHVPVRWESLRIPVRRAGGPSTVSLENATVAEIHAATRDLLVGTKRSRAHRSPTETALRALLADHAEFAATAIHVHDGSVRFGPVPLASLAEFVKLLRGFRVPTAAAAASGK